MNPDSEVTADYISREDLEFRKNQREVVYFTEARRAQIFDGTTDVVVGGGTAVASGSILATSVGADYVTVGTTVVPSMPVKVVAATGVVVGTNKFVTGLGKVWNGFYGSEVGKTPNPIRDRIPTKYQDMYDAAEIVLEVGIAHTAPHVVGMNKTPQYETYYRTMSPKHYEELLKTGKILPTGETFISPTQSFSEGYQGVLVKFKVKSGTTEELSKIGVRNGNPNIQTIYPNMPSPLKGWGERNAYFKWEKEQVNIGLGQGSALEKFNKNIKDYEMIKIIDEVKK